MRCGDGKTSKIKYILYKRAAAAWIAIENGWRRVDGSRFSNSDGRQVKFKHIYKFCQWEWEEKHIQVKKQQIL